MYGAWAARTTSPTGLCIRSTIQQPWLAIVWANYTRLLCAFGSLVTSDADSGTSDAFEDVPADESKLPVIRAQETTIKPNFDLVKALRHLDSPPLYEQLCILAAIHERFWHANTKDMVNLLRKGGISLKVLKLVPQVIRQ